MANEIGEPIGQDEAAYRTEWMMLRSIDRQLRDFSTIFRGDGSDSNPGLLVKVDRLVQESQRRSRREDQTRAWLWSLTAGIILLLLPSVIQWVGALQGPAYPYKAEAIERGPSEN